MKMIVKAKVTSIGTGEFEIPDNFNDNEIREYIKDNAEMLDWEDIDKDNIDYEIIEDNIRDEDEYINEKWEIASMQYDAWKNGDYDEN